MANDVPADDDRTWTRSVEITERDGEFPWVVTVTAIDPAGRHDVVLMQVGYTHQPYTRQLEARLTRQRGTGFPSDAMLDMAAWKLDEMGRENPGRARIELDPRVRIRARAYAALDSCDPLGDPESVHRSAAVIERDVIAARGRILGEHIRAAFAAALQRPPTSKALGEYALQLADAARWFRSYDRELRFNESVATSCDDPDTRRDGAICASRNYEDWADVTADDTVRVGLLRRSLELYRSVPPDWQQGIRAALLLYKIGDVAECGRACDELARTKAGKPVAFEALHIKRVLAARQEGKATMWGEGVPLIAEEEDASAAWLSALGAPDEGIECGADWMDSYDVAEALEQQAAGLVDAQANPDAREVARLRRNARAVWGLTLERWGGPPDPVVGPTLADEMCFRIARLSCLLGDFDTAYGAYAARLKDTGLAGAEASFSREAIRAQRVGAPVEMTVSGLRVAPSSFRTLG